MRHSHGLRAAAGNKQFDFLDPGNIGLEVEGGFFAGLISHTADGNATHALIVAPAATGASGSGYTITTNLSAKTSNTATAGTGSDFDGVVNTAAMVSAGIANHPAANFCVNLNIGGYSDWYLPARQELDIAYYNLKPRTTSNNTSWGINDYSVPKRTVYYTAGSPAQTAITAFQSGNTEAFYFVTHWSSTQPSFSNTNTQRLDFDNGEQSIILKTSTLRTRAFRRVTL